jgi:hypothetical protein
MMMMIDDYDRNEDDDDDDDDDDHDDDYIRVGGAPNAVEGGQPSPGGPGLIVVTWDDLSYYPPSVLTCPDESWTLHTDLENNITKCYRLDERNATWSDCYNSCKQTFGGSMVCPTSVSVSDWIYDDFRPFNRQIWIGFKADFIGSKDLIGSKNIYKKDEIKCYSTASYYWVDTCSPKPSGNFTNFHTPLFPTIVSEGFYYGYCFSYITKYTIKKWDVYPDDNIDINGEVYDDVYCLCEVSPYMKAFLPLTPDPSLDSPSDCPICPTTQCDEQLDKAPSIDVHLNHLFAAVVTYQLCFAVVYIGVLAGINYVIYLNSINS